MSVPMLRERIEQAILVIRGQRVMLDSDLAKLYGVSTKALNQAVKRNTDRFPKDFMFRLTQQEKSEVVTNCDHLSKLKFSRALSLQPSQSPPLLLPPASTFSAACFPVGKRVFFRGTTMRPT